MTMRRRSHGSDFDSVLDTCASEMQAGRLTLEQCLARYPDLTARLEPLLRGAATIQSLPRPALPPAARLALEWRLRVRMTHQPAPGARRRESRPMLARWAAVAAALLLMVGVVGAGVVAAAAGSLPGDVLYPVKRWSESVTAQLASQPARVDLHLAWAQRRLDEFQELAGRGVVEVALVDDLTAETKEAVASSAGLAESAQASTRERATELRTTAIEVVSRVRERAPDAAQAGLDRALSALEDAIEHGPPGVTPGPQGTRTPQPTRTPRPTRTPSPTGTPRPDLSPTPTPQGQGTPGSGLTKTPSGQGTPGSGLTQTPSGQGTPPGGPPGTPPGQEKPTKTPKP